MENSRWKKSYAMVLSVLLCLMLFIQAGMSSIVYGETKKVEKPKIETKAAAIYCVDTDRYVYKKKINKKYDPYSITKLMTGYLTVKNLDMDKKVVVSADAVLQMGSSANLQEGEVVTVKDLLNETMIHSANDAAYALGETISGNMDNFIKLMNNTAKEIGCTGTNFVNPNGIENREHYTTAADMVKIMKLAYSNKQLRKIMYTPSYRSEATNKSVEKEFKHSSGLVRKQRKGVQAVKTGCWDYYTTATVVYKKNGLTYIIVMLRSNIDVRTADMNTLLQYCGKAQHRIKAVEKNEIEGKAKVKRGAVKKVKAVVSENGYVWVPYDTPDDMIETKAVMDDNLKAPIKKGDRVGTLRMKVGKTCVGTVPLIAENPVEKGWITSILGFSNGEAAITLVVVIAAIVYIKRRIAKKKRKTKKAREMAIKELRNERKK